MKVIFFASLGFLAGPAFAEVPAPSPVSVAAAANSTAGNAAIVPSLSKSFSAQPQSSPGANFPSDTKPTSLAPSGPTLGVGAHFDELHVGKLVYHDVRVRDVTVRSILVSDTDGIASIPLRSLSPDLQRAFGYQPVLEAVSNAKIAISERQAEEAAKVRARQVTVASDAKASAKFAHLAASFGRDPEIQPVVDLRPQFRELTFGIKNQGRRPSCAIFAVVSAYEFENAQLIGKPEKLSEDYLIWATCQTLKRAPQLISPDQVAEDPAADDRDLGFSYASVLESLRVFGIAPQSEMPDTYSKIGDIVAPSPALIRDSAMRRKVTAWPLPGSDNATRLANIIHAINASVPVPIGLRWPAPRAVRTGYLDKQNPPEESRHAVTIVGYACPSGQIEQTEFIFKNSYGPLWGEAGYGRATFKYLNDNMVVALILEVSRPDEAVHASVVDK